jgi:hypothetical protein
MNTLEDDILKHASVIEPLPDLAFLERDERHRDAVAFLRAPKTPNGDIEWLAEYGKDLWTDSKAIFARIDDKADSIIKYLGGGTGIFALGVLAKVDATTAYLVFCCLPAIVCSLISVFLATLARRPRGVPSLPSVENAMRYAEMDGIKGEVEFIAQWNLACTDMKLVCLRKAHLLELATWLYVAAIGFLVLPLLAAGIWPPPANPPH